MSTAGGPERGTRTLRGGRAVVVWMWLSGKPRFGSILAKRPSSNGVRSRRGDESAGCAVYLMDSTASYSELLARLVKHTTSRVCVYIKRLSDVDLPILEQIVQQSYEYIRRRP